MPWVEAGARTSGSAASSHKGKAKAKAKAKHLKAKAKAGSGKAMANSVVHRSVVVLGVSGTLFGRRLIFTARAGERACSKPAR